MSRTHRAIQLLVPLAILALAAMFFVYSYSGPASVAEASTYQDITLSRATTTAAVTASSSVRVLATSTPYRRAYATICNASTTPVYLRLGSDAAASLSAYTAIIASTAPYSPCYEIDGDNLYQGSVTASSTGEAALPIVVTDFVL